MTKACTQARVPTDFENRVYKATAMIPAGHVSTYGAVARHLGCASPRAVGQALSRNPFAPEVPCHRVVASNLTPGGFAGRTSGHELQRKLQLLASEGVQFVSNAGRLVIENPHVVFEFPKHRHV